MTGSVEQGARNAIETCMNVQPGERVVLVTDRVVPEVGDALEAAARRRTDRVQRFTLEDFAPRPHTECPKALLDAANSCEVSLWAASSAKGELPARMAYRKALGKRARHGHMPGITRQLMEMGMNADYDVVANLTSRLHQRLQGASHVRVTSPHGTDFEVLLHPNWKWLPDTGHFHNAGDWGNLPAGECYTAPAWLHGRIVTHLLGDYLSEKHKALDPPLVFDVRDSRIDLDSIHGAKPQVVADFKEYITQDPLGTRAGEFAMGTNLALDRVVGNLLQDEKIPGVHVAFGHPYSDETGAPWTAKTHIDVVILDTDVNVDGKPVQRSGKYVF